MGLRDLIEDVLILQTDWSRQNTEAMQQRAQRVLHDIPAWLIERLGELVLSATWPERDLAVDSSDGAGGKSEIPWVRLHSASRSPGATLGWYVVFLFGALGDRCYLSLMPGTSRWHDHGPVSRPAAETIALVEWARTKLSGHIEDPRLSQHIRLDARRTELGPAYERGTVVAVEYDLDTIPDDTQLLDDLHMVLSLLSTIYRETDSDPLMPGSESPEIAAATREIDAAAGKQWVARGGQGFRVTKAEQRAVERRAVDLATEHLSGLGWAVKDVGAKESYDLHCERDGAVLYVEVKGTTTAGDRVLLTRNEVQLHRDKYPNNCLAVVSQIVLDRIGEDPTAHGGKLELVSPWSLDDGRLEPIAFTYQRLHPATHPEIPL